MRIFNPCFECLIKVCCSNKCDEKEEYEHDIETFDRMSKVYVSDYWKHLHENLFSFILFKE